MDKIINYNMTLSIIIPVYNVEAYLRKCLDSILVDNAFTGQVICVNDGSTDESLAILEQYAARYPNLEIVSQTNSGLSVARNTGFDRATGDYVFFPDSDDWIFPGSLNKIMSHLDGEDVMYFNAIKYYEDTTTYGKEIDIPTIKDMNGSAYFKVIYDKPRNMPCVCVWGGVYLRSFLLNNQLYNEPGIYHEDNYFTPQVLLSAEKVSSINEYVYVYRIRGGSITANVRPKHINDLLFIARNLYSKYKQKTNVADVFYKDICNIYINLINTAYNHNIPLRKLWRFRDTKHMIRCAYDSRSRKIAKLTMLSPYIAYRYMQDRLPIIIRKFVNRFL